jgi:predicted kinase
MVLILIRGIPGSGKTTFAKALLKRINAYFYEADMFFMTESGYRFEASKLNLAHHFCFNNTKNALANNSNCIVANTFSTLSEIEPYLNLGKEYNARIVIYRMTGHYQNVHSVPEKTIMKIQNRFIDMPNEILE